MEHPLRTGFSPDGTDGLLARTFPVPLRDGC